MYKKITYCGNTIFNINFGLYGVLDDEDEEQDINFEATKDSIKSFFSDKYKEQIQKKLKVLGLKFCGLNYYSPKAYNFANDSLDLILRVSNKDTLKKAILKHKKQINEALSKNKSYDGFISTTAYDVNEELEKLNKPNYEPDILVLRTLLNFKLEFDIHNIFDNVVYEMED